jgi:hypothetical protein
LYGALKTRSGEAQGILVLFTALEMQHLKQSNKTYWVINWSQINFISAIIPGLFNPTVSSSNFTGSSRYKALGRTER